MSMQSFGFGYNKIGVNIIRIRNLLVFVQECFMEQPNVQISTKVDVWSIGVILIEMIFGKKPFGEGISQERIAQERVFLNSFQVIFPLQSTVSQECKDFILKCLTYNMEARWNITEAFYSNYIQL
ncbi:unnamed protein product [Paramecium sonneborni]|uniref:Protein kinase domain-containing protein n=1 Tax=Paramecium sonneborni TaxID=65129 RepID=A0A8S1PW10_9CILI|nr:unnamed protein product [Paramecium sonneborni]